MSTWPQRGSTYNTQSYVNVDINADGTVIAGVNGNNLCEIRRWNGTAWNTELSLTRTNSWASSVAINKGGNGVASGTVVVFGLQGLNRAEVWAYNGSSWVQRGANIGNPLGGGSFGNSVAINADGTRVAVGDPDGDVYLTNTTNPTNFASNGENDGTVSVFYWRTSDSSWAFMGETWKNIIFGTSGTSGQERMAWSQSNYWGRPLVMSDDGTIVVIGSTHWDTSGDNNAGRFRVFVWSNGTNNVTGSWSQRASVVTPVAVDQGKFGFTLAVDASANNVAVGQPYGGTNLNNTFVRIYNWNGSSYNNTATFNAPNSTEAGDNFLNTGSWGQSIALSQNSTILAIGSPFTGKVFVYQNSGSWVLGETITVGNRFGRTLSMSGNGWLVVSGNGGTYIYSPAAPGAPTSLTATAGSSAISVSFTAPSGVISSYEYQTTDASGNVSAWINSGVATSPVTISGLTPGLAYTAKLRALSPFGNGTESASSTSATPYTLPGAPTITAATVTNGNNTALVSWTAPTFNGFNNITQYQSQHSTNGGTTWSTYTNRGTAQPLSVSGLTAGVSTIIRIRAVNAAGGGPDSNISDPVIPITVPGAPTLGSVTAGNMIISVSGFTAPLSDGSSAITGYQYNLNGGTWVNTVSTPGPFDITTGIVGGTAYVVRVRAVNIVGGGTQSTASASVTPFTIPAAPTINSVTPGNGTIAVAFTAGSANGSTITNYEYAIDASGLVWTSVGSIISPFTISGLTNGTPYVVRLRAINAAGSGATATSSSVTPRTIPNAPTINSLTSSVSVANTLVVSFNPITTIPENGGSAITNYEYQLTDGSGVAGSWVSRGGVLTSPFNITTGFTAGLFYTIKIRAINAAGTGPESLASDPALVYNVPTAPTITSVIAGDKTLSVSFTAPTNLGGTSIIKYQRSFNGSTWIDASDSNPFTIEGLTNGTAYSVYLRAINSTGNGTATAAFTAVKAGTPSVPRNLVVTGAFSSIIVSFDTPEFDGGFAITNYQYSTNNGSTWVAANTTASPITITGLTNGTTYTVRLRALNSIGDGAVAISGSVIPRTVPGAPNINSVTAGNMTITVNFTAPGSNGGSAITNYEYQLTDASNNTYGWVSRGGTTSPFSITTGLVGGIGYRVQLRAVNAAGSSTGSSLSTQVTPFTIPDTPVISFITPANTSLIVYFIPPFNRGSNITSYQYSTNNGTNWVSATITTETISSILYSKFTISSLTNNVSYTVILRANNAAGSSLASVGVSAMPSSTPNQPTNVVLSVTANVQAITVTFTAPTSVGTGITNYQYSFDNVTWTSANVTSSPFTISSGITYGTSRSLYLRGVNAAGSGTASAISNTVTPFTTPGAPTGVTLSVTANVLALNVTFTAPASNGGSAITRYEYSVDGGGYINAGLSTSFTILPAAWSLTYGVSYAIRVRAVNAAGNGTESSLSNRIIPFTRSQPPTNVTISFTPKIAALNVTLTPGALNGGAAVTNYLYVLRNETTNVSSAELSADSSANSFTIHSGITFGNTYSIRLIAVNAAGNSNYSDWSNSVMPYTSPGAPASITVTSLVNSFEVSFTPTPPENNGSNSITGYKYSLNSTTTYIDITNAVNNTFTITSGVVSNQAYVIRVAAVNQAGVGTPVVSSTVYPLSQTLAAIQNLGVIPSVETFVSNVKNTPIVNNQRIELSELGVTVDRTLSGANQDIVKTTIINTIFEQVPEVTSFKVDRSELFSARVPADLEVVVFKSSFTTEQNPITIDQQLASSFSIYSLMDRIGDFNYFNFDGNTFYITKIGLDTYSFTNADNEVSIHKEHQIIEYLDLRIVFGSVEISNNSTSIPISIDFDIEYDAVTGEINMMSDTFHGINKNNIIVPVRDLPVNALYDASTNTGLIEFWEPSNNPNNLLCQLANLNTGYSNFTNSYNIVSKRLVKGLQKILCDQFDCSAATPFNDNIYNNANRQYYTTQRDFGRLSLSTLSHYIFNHMDATAAISNDSEFIRNVLSINNDASGISAANDYTQNGAINRYNSWRKLNEITNTNVLAWDDTQSVLDANLAIKIVKKIIEKGYQNGQFVVSDKLTAIPGSLAMIMSQVLGQDYTRMINHDNSERGANVHQLLKFCENDHIFLNIRVLRPDITAPNNVISGNSFASLYTNNLNYTLKIKLGPRDSTL